MNVRYINYKDLTKKPYIHDRDERVFIGIDLPFRKSESKEGYFASTSTTIPKNIQTITTQTATILIINIQQKHIPQQINNKNQ